MSKRAIYIIVILMSVALMGIAIIQYLWIKRSVDLRQRNFDDKVLIAMSKVRESLFQDALQRDYYAKFYQDHLRRLQRPKTSFGQSQVQLKILDKDQLLSTLMMVSPNKFLAGIKPDILDKYIKTAVKEQRINLTYDYGVLSNETENFYILNGHYVTDFGGMTDQASNLVTDENLYSSPHEINLSLNEEAGVGKLVLYFPKREASTWRSVLPNLLTSLLFTSLVLFCFIYTIGIIVRQKKVGEMKTDFINNMTHEFKTPIATISLASDSIPMVIKDEERVNKFVNIIRQENQRMLRQVEKVLQISKAEKDDLQLNITEINVNELAQVAADNTSLLVQSKGGTLTTDLSATLPIIEGDQTHISNIIHNLLDNANKYSKETPEIHVATKDTKDGVEIVIEDKGIGMTKESLKFIFDKFYRVHTGNLHDVKGFGLGLSYVKSMVDRHYGNVKVKSELNKGSTFTVFLPRRHKI
jgi:two-component system phosphate regulon sensor histidine kinase PhoR